MSFEVKGTVVEVYDENQVTDRFKKREFVIEVKDGMYSEFVKMQLVQDKTSLIDAFRPYTRDGKTTYFTNLDAWRIAPAGNEASQQHAEGTTSNDSNDDIAGLSFSEAGEDELPF